MRTLRLILILAVLFSGLVAVGLTAPTPVAKAQSCSVVDTFTAAGVTSSSSTWAGSYYTIPGRRYTVTVSGTGIRGDGWVFDPVYAWVDSSWASAFYSQFTFGNSQRNRPAYSSSHSYDIQIFGNGQPFTIGTLGYSTTSITISFDVSVCEDPQPYTTPSCTLVGQMNITSPSPTTGPVLTNGHTYDLYIAGEFIPEGANLDDYYNRSADPAAYTSTGWSAQYFPYNLPQGNVGITFGTAANYTLITSTYQSSHFYHATIDGTGVAIQLSLGGGWYIYGGGFVAYICDPSITPTPSPTYSLPTATPTVTPTTYPPVFSHRICLLLADRAEFRSGWTLTGGATFTYDDPNRFLTLPPGGNAKLVLALSPTKKYGVSVLLRALQTGDNGTITLGIGTSAAYSIPVESHTDLRGFTTEAINYDPDTTGGYTVTFSRPAASTGNVVVEYFCIQAKTSSASDEGNASDGSGSSSDRCSTCVAPDWFGDIGGILNWLICQLKNLLTCYLAQFLIWIQGGIAKLTGFTLDIFIWLVDGFNGFVRWARSTVIAQWFGASDLAQNVGAQASNAFHTSGIASALNYVAAGTRDLPTTIYNVFNGLVGQVTDAIAFSTGPSGIIRLVEIIIKLVVVAFSAIVFAIGLAIVMITSLLIGFFQPSNITSLSMTCTNPSSYVYYPCLIFYALDNTVLAGPAGYLFPLVMGLWAIQTFVWALNRVKEEISA